MGNKIVIQSRCAFFLAKILSTELEIVNLKKKGYKNLEIYFFYKKIS